MAGITDEIFAKTATQGWEMLPMERRKIIKKGTAALEMATHTFNVATEDDKITPEEFGDMITKIQAAMGETGNAAFQAMFWSLLKRSG